MSRWHTADCKELNWDYSLWHRCNWFAANLQTTSTTKFKPVSRFINLSNSRCVCRLPGQKPPCAALPSTTTSCDSSALTCIRDVRVSSSFKLHVWQEHSLHSSSVSLNEVHVITGKAAHCCRGWLKQHQSLSLWLWMHHMSAYMRAVLNNSPSLNIPPQSEMEKCILTNNNLNM